MRFSLFWYVTQRRLVIIYRRFGTTYRFYLQESSRTAWPLKTGQRSCSETSTNTNLRCVTFQKREDFKDMHFPFLSCTWLYHYIVDQLSVIFHAGCAQGGGGPVKAEVPASVVTLLSQNKREKDRLDEYVFTLQQLPHSIQVAPVLTWSFVDEVKEREY